MIQLAQDTVIETILEIINENGFDGLGEAVSILINEAMKVERSTALNAAPWQRTDTRKGYANGLKDKTLASRFGNLLLKIPQVRGDVTFHPSALDKGLCSERALKIAVAEIYVQGVSTRKVASIVFLMSLGNAARPICSESQRHMCLKQQCARKWPSGRNQFFSFVWYVFCVSVFCISLLSNQKSLGL